MPSVRASGSVARGAPRLDLSDALSLIQLMAAQRDDLCERAALRWHARLKLEVPGLTLAESALALSALLALRRSPETGPPRRPSTRCYADVVCGRRESSLLDDRDNGRLRADDYQTVVRSWSGLSKFG
jgi:predicted RNA polymerase sigma factor